MSELKCPKCGGRLIYWGATGALLKCSQCGFGWGNEELWQELDRWKQSAEDHQNWLRLAEKRLDVAIRGLDQMTWGCDSTDAEYLLKEIKEITAPEQKDVK